MGDDSFPQQRSYISGILSLRQETKSIQSTIAFGAIYLTVVTLNLSSSFSSSSYIQDRNCVGEARRTPTMSVIIEATTSPGFKWVSLSQWLAVGLILFALNTWVSLMIASSGGIFAVITLVHGLEIMI
jgi:hypothetical protein